MLIYHIYTTDLISILINSSRIYSENYQWIHLIFSEFKNQFELQRKFPKSWKHLEGSETLKEERKKERILLAVSSCI